jgi:GntR family transcriptional regulator
MALEHTSPLPLYHQLEQALGERIARGEYGTGTAIPGELDLAREFGVSRGTIRQAIERLVRRGLIVRQRGRGSFVARGPLDYPLGSFYSFAHEMADRGIPESSRVLAQRRIRPAASVARALALEPGAVAVRIVRLRLAGDRPFLLETSHVPAALVPSLVEADLSRGSIYDVMEADGVRLTRVTEHVRSVTIDARAAGALQARAGSPGFALERLGIAGATPAELRHVIAPGDRVRLTASWGQAPKVVQ